jgi:adenylate cyclase
MAADHVERRLAAILAADVVGYARLMEADEAGTRARFNAHLKELVEPAIADHRGRLVKTTGDGLLVEFPSAVDAVQCSVAIQQGMTERNAGVDESRRIEFRIGVNLGDVIVEGDDLHGDGVNIAARLEGLAEPGGIRVSGKLYQEVRNKLDAAFEDLGEKEVKNIAAPLRVYGIGLETPQSAAPAADAVLQRPAVAVLPFQNMSGDPEQEYFADGLTEDLITALSYSRAFPVIARNSTFIYKGTSPDVRKVAEELGARYVIEGSVRKSGDRLRITAQVIDASTGHHVWAERFDRNLEDFFDLQEEIAHRVASAVEPELAKAELRRSAGKSTSSLDAWECYQRSLTLMEEVSRDGHKQARDLFNRAIELDPGFGQAYAGLALSYHRDLYLGFADDFDACRAELFKAAQKAVALDDRDAFAHSMFGFAFMWQRKPKLAIVQCEKAIEVNPSCAWGYGVLAGALLGDGRYLECIETYEKALDLNPTDPWNYIRTTFMAEAHMYCGHYEEAVAWAQNSIGRASNHLHAHLVLAASLGYLDRKEEARSALDECERIHHGIADSWMETDLFRSLRPQKDTDHLREGLRKAGLVE